MIAREMFVTMLQWANDETLDNLLSVPGLEFAIPCPGLRWVQYVGNNCGRVDGKVVTFDISKVQGVRCLKQESTIQVDDDLELKEMQVSELSVAEAVADLKDAEADLEDNGGPLNIEPLPTVAGSVGEELESELERDTNAEPNSVDNASGGLNMPL